MSIFSKLGVDIAAPTDSAGSPRKVVNGEMQTWMTEVERLFKAGSFNSVDAVGLYADRSTYDGEAEGFVYLSIDGDGAGSSSTVAFIKESAASGDWSPPVPFQGDKGWSPLFRVVNDGARRLLEVYDWIGGDGEKPDLIGYIGAAGLTANIAEAVDIRGPQGVSGSGLSWSFEAGTADEDPGAGKLRANAADLSAATELFVSKVSAGGDPVASFLAGLTNSTSTHKGYLILTEPSSGAQATYDVTGTTDAAGYVKIAVSGHSGAAALTNAALLSVAFSRTGNAGDLNGVNPGTAGLAVLGAETPAAARDAINLSFLVTPEEHGAVGDGSTDDTVAVNDAIVAASTVGGTVLLSKQYGVDLLEIDRSASFLGRNGGGFVHVGTGTRPAINVTGDDIELFFDGVLFDGDKGSIQASATRPLFYSHRNLGVVNPDLTKTSGSPTATVSDATGISPGMYITGTGVPAGTTIASIVGATVTLSQNATTTGTDECLIFHHISVANRYFFRDCHFTRTMFGAIRLYGDSVNGERDVLDVVGCTFDDPASNDECESQPVFVQLADGVIARFRGNSFYGVNVGSDPIVSTNLTTTSGSATATVASATGLSVGMTVWSPSSVSPKTKITNIAGTTLTLSKVATSTGTNAAKFVLKDSVPAVWVAQYYTRDVLYSDVLFEGNIVKNCGSRMLPGIGAFDAYWPCHNLIVTDNEFLSCCSTPIRGKAGSRKVLIDGNTVDHIQGALDAYNGIGFVDPPAFPGGDNYTITNNIIRSLTDTPGSHAIAIVGNASGHPPKIKTALISGNQLDRVVNGIYVYDVIDASIFGNQISTATGVGVKARQVNALDACNNRFRDITGSVFDIRDLTEGLTLNDNSAHNVSGDFAELRAIAGAVIVSGNRGYVLRSNGIYVYDGTGSTVGWLIEGNHMVHFGGVAVDTAIHAVGLTRVRLANNAAYLFANALSFGSSTQVDILGNSAWACTSAKNNTGSITTLNDPAT